MPVSEAVESEAPEEDKRGKRYKTIFHIPCESSTANRAPKGTGSFPRFPLMTRGHEEWPSNASDPH